MSLQRNLILSMAFLLTSLAHAQTPPLNILLLVDAGSSMSASLQGETKVQAVYKALQQVLHALPNQSGNFQIGLRILGGASSINKKTPAECANSTLLAPLADLATDSFLAQAKAYQPAGSTPIAFALEQAVQDFPAEARNVILLIAATEDTCSADPCEAAKSVATGPAKATIHVIGLGVKRIEAAILKCIQINSGGLYFDADSSASLAMVLLSAITRETEALGIVLPPPPQDISTLQFPEIHLPSTSLPDIKTSHLKLPEVITPDVKASYGRAEKLLSPSVSSPNVSTMNVQIPNVWLPEVSLPKSNLPSWNMLEQSVIEAAPETSAGYTECKPGQTCACEPGKKCLLDCVKGGCNLLCKQGALCTFQCVGGNCTMASEPASIVDFHCEGGGCSMTAASGSVAKFVCPGGNCKTACGANSNCWLQCPPGNCSIQCAPGAVCK